MKTACSYGTAPTAPGPVVVADRNGTPLVPISAAKTGYSVGQSLLAASTASAAPVASVASVDVVMTAGG